MKKIIIIYICSFYQDKNYWYKNIRYSNKFKTILAIICTISIVISIILLILLALIICYYTGKYMDIFNMGDGIDNSNIILNILIGFTYYLILTLIITILISFILIIYLLFCGILFIINKYIKHENRDEHIDES